MTYEPGDESGVSLQSFIQGQQNIMFGYYFGLEWKTACHKLLPPFLKTNGRIFIGF